jgi:hypothetical protein
MQSLRAARHLTRLVLVWFALSLGIAVAAPLVNPLSAQMVCSGAGGMKLVAPDGGEVAAGHTLQCPLCAPVGAPPPAAMPAVQATQPASSIAQPALRTPVAALAFQPPARGPPLELSI